MQGDEQLPSRASSLSPLFFSSTLLRAIIAVAIRFRSIGRCLWVLIYLVNNARHCTYLTYPGMYSKLLDGSLCLEITY